MRLQNKLPRLHILFISFSTEESNSIQKLLEQYIWKDYLLEVEYHNCKNGFQMISQLDKIDILFCNELDNDKYETIKILKEKHPWMAIYVFLKDYHHIQSAFSLRVEQVFEKPLNADLFVKYFYESFQSLWIYVNQHLIIPISDIIYIEYMQRKSYVYFSDYFIKSSRSLKEWMKLLSNRGFVRINRYTIVNINHVIVGQNEIRTVNGKTFALSKRYQELLKQ